MPNQVARTFIHLCLSCSPKELSQHIERRFLSLLVPLDKLFTFPKQGYGVFQRDGRDALFVWIAQHIQIHADVVEQPPPRAGFALRPSFLKALPYRSEGGLGVGVVDCPTDSFSASRRSFAWRCLPSIATSSASVRFRLWFHSFEISWRVNTSPPSLVCWTERACLSNPSSSLDWMLKEPPACFINAINSFE